MLRKTITATALASLTAGAVAALAPSAHAADFSAYKFCGMASQLHGRQCRTADLVPVRQGHAQRVREGGRAKSVRVFSPVTHRCYTMHARFVENVQDSPYIQFTGGNDASVRMVS